MSGYIDVEGMRTAASNMSSAAQGMKDAASWFHDYTQQHLSGLRDHVDAMRILQEREIRLLALRAELEGMVANDAGKPDQAGRYCESAYHDLQKKIEDLL